MKTCNNTDTSLLNCDEIPMESCMFKKHQELIINNKDKNLYYLYMESSKTIARRTTLNKTREDILEEINIAEDRIRRYNIYIINLNREIEEKQQEINDSILPPKSVRRYQLEIEKKKKVFVIFVEILKLKKRVSRELSKNL